MIAMHLLKNHCARVCHRCSLLKQSFWMVGLDYWTKSSSMRLINHRSSSDPFDVFVSDLTDLKIDQWKNKSRNSKKGLFGPSSVKNYTGNAVKFGRVSHKLADTSPDFLHGGMLDIFEAAKTGDLDRVSILIALMSSVDKFTLDELHKLANMFVETRLPEGIDLLEEIASKEYTTGAPHFYEMKLTCLKQNEDNQKALILCGELYRQYPHIRRVLRSHLSHILIDIVRLHSDAALVQAKYVTVGLGVQFRDFRPMASLWHACFLSEWFSDQKIASELLELAITHSAIKVLERRIIAATFTALAQHRSQLVYNLIEDLLRHKLQLHYSVVLRALFDYKCSMRDLKGCAAIMHAALDSSIVFSSEQHARFLELLCQKKSMSDNSESSDPKDPEPPPPFQMKF